MSDQTTCEVTRSAISSPGSASGRTHFGSPDGLTTDLFGPVPVRASRSPLQPSHTSGNGSKIIDIYPRHGCGLSASADLTRALANRLEVATARRGSMTFSITWKHTTTPAGRLLPAQLVRALTISEGGFTSLPTPCARDGRDISRSNAFLSQRKRHSPSLATRLLDSGHSWRVITAAYCLAMNLPLLWNAAAPADTATQSTRKRQKSSSAQPTKP